MKSSDKVNLTLEIQRKKGELLGQLAAMTARAEKAEAEIHVYEEKNSELEAIAEAAQEVVDIHKPGGSAAKRTASVVALRAALASIEGEGGGE